jgi:hypothetical protein
VEFLGQMVVLYKPLEELPDSFSYGLHFTFPLTVYKKSDFPTSLLTLVTWCVHGHPWMWRSLWFDLYLLTNTVQQGVTPVMIFCSFLKLFIFFAIEW